MALNKEKKTLWLAKILFEWIIKNTSVWLYNYSNYSSWNK